MTAGRVFFSPVPELRKDPAPSVFGFAPWLKQDRIHGFTTRRYSGSESRAFDPIAHAGSSPGQVTDDQEKLLKWGPEGNDYLIRPEQVHGARTPWTDEVETEQGDTVYERVVPNADGLLSERKDDRIICYGADCPLVLLIGPGPVKGAFHMSWKGLYRGIVQSAGDNLKTRLSKAERRETEILIGPSIRDCCYEVGIDFRDRFLHQYPELDSCFRKQQGNLYFSLQQAISVLFRDQTDIPSSNIHDLNLCNACRNDLFYSYRRSGIETGRMVGLISS